MKRNDYHEIIEKVMNELRGTRQHLPDDENCGEISHLEGLAWDQLLMAAYLMDRMLVKGTLDRKASSG